MKVELDEKSKMGRVRIVSDTQEEVDEFFSEINKIIKLTEDNINFYISSIQKQNLIEDISESEEDVIYDMISTGMSLIKDTIIKYIENYHEIVIDLEYDYDERHVVIENMLYVPEDRVLH